MRRTSTNTSAAMLLYINGKKHLLNPSPSLLLVDLLRDTLNLKGTKIGCGEGGCGACTVIFGIWDPSTRKVSWAPINSCLRLVATLDGTAIITVEGMGNTRDGLNPVQERLAEGNGTQCGFCTPGWVTNMYGLLLQKGTDLSAKEIEKHFDGNLCRCTGYRPILEAFKTFAKEDGGQATTCLLQQGSGACGGGGHGKEGKGKSAHLPCQRGGGCRHKGGASREQGEVEEEEDGWVKVDKHHGGADPGPVDVEDLCSTLRTPPPHLRGPYTGRLEPPFPDELKAYLPTSLRFESQDGRQVFQRVLTLDELLSALREHTGQAVQLAVGNTSLGVSKYYNLTAPANVPDKYQVIVDISRVPLLTECQYDETTGKLVVGSAVTLTRLIEILKVHDGGPPPSFPLGLSAVGVVHTHLARVAHEQVRNAGSWAGNLMLFKRHRDFPSDVNVVFTAAGVVLRVVEMGGGTRDVTMLEFWDMDAEASPFVILSATFNTRPALSEIVGSIVSTRDNDVQLAAGPTEVVARSFRVAQRAVNSHAHVNAAMVGHILPGDEDKPSVCAGISLAFSGVSKTAFRAHKCEAALRGQPMTEATLSSALAALDADLTTAGLCTAYGDQDFREKLMRSYLYMYFLTCQGPTLSPYLASGGAQYDRPVSTATQSFTPDPSLSPVSEPVMKLAGPMQCTGEATYTDDEPTPPGTLYGALVYSTQACAKVTAINTEKALEVDGVVDVILASDIPGSNDLTMGYHDEFFLVPEQGTVECVGAAVGVVVAESLEVAREAARLVTVTYQPLLDEDGNVIKPIITLADAIARQSFLPGVAGSVKELKVGDVKKALEQAKRTASGRILAGGQKHFYFEPQTSLAVSSEGGVLAIYLSTQAPSDTHTVVTKILGVAKHKCTVQTRRTGGGFGGKLTRCFQNAAAAAVAANKLRRAVRVTNDRTTDFVVVGGREGMCFDYEVGFEDDGKVTALKLKMYMDGGAATDNTLGDMDMGMLWADNTYYFPNYHAQAYCCKTNTAVTTSMRAPGVVQSVMATEMIMQHIASEVGRPVTEVQELNFYRDGQKTPYGQTLTGLTLPTVWQQLKDKAKIDDKQAAVDAFNKTNRWHKRGVSMTAVKYGIAHGGLKAAASVKVYQEDGSVVINHYGCELGQGIHTKVAQAAAYQLGVPLDSITVTPTTTDKIPNSTATGGSSTSETAVQAMLNACKELTTRLEPYKTKLGDKATWTDVVAAAAADGVCLSVEVGKERQKGWYAPLPGDDVFKYFVHCAAATVVEVNLLTGELQILSTDLVYDCGTSLNPLADIGQIEGAYIQGVGYYTTEEVAYDDNGMLLSAGTWDYKPPSALDIPIDFKVSLLPNLPNPEGVLRSKATGEPPYMIANSTYFAIKRALVAARAEAGVVERDFDLPIPASVDARLQATLLDPKQFKLSWEK